MDAEIEQRIRHAFSRRFEATIDFEPLLIADADGATLVAGRLINHAESRLAAGSFDAAQDRLYRGFDFSVGSSKDPSWIHWGSWRHSDECMAWAGFLDPTVDADRVRLVFRDHESLTRRPENNVVFFVYPAHEGRIGVTVEAISTAGTVTQSMSLGSSTS